MACAGANGLGTITNLEKKAIENPVREPSNGLVKPSQVTLACYPARARLINWALHVRQKTIGWT